MLVIGRGENKLAAISREGGVTTRFRLSPNLIISPRSQTLGAFPVVSRDEPSVWSIDTYDLSVKGKFTVAGQAIRWWR